MNHRPALRRPLLPALSLVACLSLAAPVLARAADVKPPGAEDVGAEDDPVRIPETMVSRFAI